MLVATGLICFATSSGATCSLSAEKQPHGVVGLQLFVPDDPRAWADADDLGVTWLRIEIRWDSFEPTRDHFDTSNVDKVMAVANQHQQKIMLLFNHPPMWAVEEPALLPDRAAKALALLVKRHGKRISAWEIFNEPNLPGYGWPAFGKSTQESASIYARALSAAASKIREFDKKAFIISAGLSPQNDPESYARWLVRLTPPMCYDAFGLHPYGQQGRFANVQSNASLLLAEEKRPPKPVWGTEYGTSDDALRGELIATLAREKNTFPITFFFTDRDIGFFSERYGLRRKDGSTKPDYMSFKTLINQSGELAPKQKLQSENGK